MRPASGASSSKALSLPARNWRTSSTMRSSMAWRSGLAVRRPPAGAGATLSPPSEPSDPLDRTLTPVGLLIRLELPLAIMGLSSRKSLPAINRPVGREVIPNFAKRESATFVEEVLVDASLLYRTVLTRRLAERGPWSYFTVFWKNSSIISAMVSSWGSGSRHSDAAKWRETDHLSFVSWHL